MIDTEPLIVRGLDALLPEVAAPSDWSDVKRRAGLGAKRIAWKVAAAMLVVGVVAVGAVAATGFGTFGRWLTGEPGLPAPPAEQQAFSQQIRSWKGFPATTELRRVLNLHADGSDFAVDAYRGAGALCLRVVAKGAAAGSTGACVPLALLRATRQAAWVLAADRSMGPTRVLRNGPVPYAVSPATITFGVAADGVTRVAVTRTDSSVTNAVVADGVFLSVTAKPPARAEVSRIDAYAGANTEAIRFQPSATIYGRPSGAMTPAKVGGPTHVQRVVHGGAVHWFARRQPRGIAVPPTLHHIAGVLPDVIFARMITPDPTQPERMVVSLRPAGTAYFGGRLKNNRSMCAELVGPRYFSIAGGCGPAGRVFSYAPFSWGIAQTPGDQTVMIAGLASDDVAAMRLFTAAGRATPVPLHDNGYFALAGTGEYPLRLVAYDDHGLVIGTRTFFAPRQMAGPTPLLGARAKLVLRNAAGKAWVIPGTGGTTCYEFETNGGGSLSCTPEQLPPGALRLGSGSPSKTNTIYVYGRVGAQVAAVRVEYRDGAPVTVDTSHGIVLATVPKRGSSISGGVERLVGMSRSGTRVSVERVGPP